MKKPLLAALIAALSLSLSACTMNEDGAHFTGMNAGDPGSYCYEHTAVCVIGGVAVAGIAAGIIANKSESKAQTAPPPLPSDSRLKRDIRPLMTLGNGLKLYTYRYTGDQRRFSGVLAQDLLRNPRFAPAVSRGADGYYRVDYAKLGLPLVNPGLMREAGEAAIQRQS